MWEWLKEHLDRILAVAGLVIVIYQLNQANEHYKWSNYNQLNIHYSSLYKGASERFEEKCLKLAQLTSNEKKWIRRYFNLYSEEHYLYIENLMPREMWEKRIDGGVYVNLKTYPILVKGYKYWKEIGAFTHPKEFIPFVDKKISSMASEFTEINKQCEGTEVLIKKEK